MYNSAIKNEEGGQATGCCEIMIGPTSAPRRRVVIGPTLGRRSLVVGVFTYSTISVSKIYKL